MTTSVCNERTFTWSQANVEQRNLNRSYSKVERKKNEHTVPLFINANLLPLHFLYNEILSRLMHDVRNASAPPKICNLFTKTSTIHSHNSRSFASNNFYIKRSRLEVQKMLFRKLEQKLWNKIPYSLTELPKSPFKKRIQVNCPVL